MQLSAFIREASCRRWCLIQKLKISQNAEHKDYIICEQRLLDTTGLLPSKLTVAVITCRKPAQDWIHQHFIKDERAPEAPPFPELLTLPEGPFSVNVSLVWGTSLPQWHNHQKVAQVPIDTLPHMVIQATRFTLSEPCVCSLSFFLSLPLPTDTEGTGWEGR